MITLAIDTSEGRGSVALLRDGVVAAGRKHEGGSDYSGWLLPAVEDLLGEAGIKLELVDLLAVATGPGSFTGLRVGVTTVKAWAEVYGKRIVGVSRLEAMVQSEDIVEGIAAVSYDAQRGQLFGGIYRKVSQRWERVGSELVISLEEFASLVDTQAGEERVAWISLDPQVIKNNEVVQRRVAQGDRVLGCSSELAGSIGVLAEKSAEAGIFSDPLTLDANYVRRSDAEIFWKGPSSGVR